jgi:hypothetical protein
MYYVSELRLLYWDCMQLQRQRQRVVDIVPGFVGIPQVEWDAVFAANR